MSNDLEVTFMKQRVADLESAASMQRSRTLNTLMDLRVMLQDGDYDEALEMLDVLVGVDEGWPLSFG